VGSPEMGPGAILGKVPQRQYYRAHKLCARERWKVDRLLSSPCGDASEWQTLPGARANRKFWEL